MNLFRIHIRPKVGCQDMAAVFRYCLENGLLGVGWRAPGLADTEEWEVYERVAKPEHKSLQQPRYIHDNVRRGDLVWTRDPHGRYYLARVTAPWAYWISEEGREKDIDIANIFRCDFHEARLDDVPKKVVASFHRGLSIQRILDCAAQVDSQKLWNLYVGQQIY